MLNLIDIAQKIINLPRFSKRLIVIIFDLSLCVVCTWFAFYLRLEKFISINDTNILITLISISIAIPIFWLFGLYRTIFRFGGQSLIFTVTLAVGIYGLFYFFIIGVYVIQGVPRSIGIIQPLLLFFGISSSRIIIEYLFINSFFQTNFKNKKKILIYGAGSAGRQILTSLENNPEMEVVGFLDDNTQYHNQLILGQTVYDPLKIKELIILKDINLVLLAIPLINRAKRNDIIDYLNSFKITVKTLPSIQDIVDDKISFSDIKDLTVEDLLSRDEVQPNQELLSKDIYSKTVLVSGAGGSIGSELCRQIVKLKPQKLLLLELNEYALFKISEDLKKTENNIKIIPLLINVQNSSRLNVVFETFKIDTVYHAAAYKHVSLVEENICESVKNNVFGTFLITQAAIKNKVSNFVLISTDKAVRSTNVMGATKRLAEICVQSLYNYDKVKKTKFAIVRFGNVLQSSGSVIPKFRKQIMEGGPLTLTDPEVTRYFMTIKEASQLVIQAGALSESCEVFVLDMGESVKIYDLIHKMIKLSGLTVKDSKNLNGDIEIKITGLRPGEKLYEELLIGDNPRKTSHKKIQKAQDPFILFNELKIDLDILSTLLETNRVSEVKSMLNKLIPSFQSNSKIIDHIHEERSIFKNEIKKTSLTNYKENKVVRIKTK
jgi:FlaA1/EpsC-like NDP-sugar epimerase